jgi:hypothetical protein
MTKVSSWLSGQAKLSFNQKDYGHSGTTAKEAWIKGTITPVLNRQPARSEFGELLLAHITFFRPALDFVFRISSVSCHCCRPACRAKLTEESPLSIYMARGPAPLYILWDNITLPCLGEWLLASVRLIQDRWKHMEGNLISSLLRTSCRSCPRHLCRRFRAGVWSWRHWSMYCILPTATLQLWGVQQLRPVGLAKVIYQFVDLLRTGTGPYGQPAWSCPTKCPFSSSFFRLRQHGHHLWAGGPFLC